jgi:predicted GH43/DUF377 family glycosyl hydrolase
MTVAFAKTRLLGPDDFAPSSEEFQVLGAFNPAVTKLDDQVVMLVRVAEQPTDEREGSFPLPRYDPDRGHVVDWFRDDEIGEASDARVIRLRSTGAARLTSASHLRVAYCGDGRRVERLGVAIQPIARYEEYGLEDPRITRIGDRYWITYVAVSRHGAATGLLSTKDFNAFERHGVIFPPENKDVVLFPEPIDRSYVALHRPVCAIPFTGPEMWVARSPDLVHWGGHEPLYRGQTAWESGRVGAGAPPLRTERGWLEIYHGNRRPTRAGHVGAYCAGAMLLDLENPGRILRVAPHSLIEPTEDFERLGFVPDVVFPGGVVESNGSVLIYYGAADQCTAVAETTWDELWTTFDGESASERVSV